MAKVRVIVEDGLVVNYNKKKYPPGKIFDCEEKEAFRLRKAGAVKFAEEVKSSEAAPVQLKELTDRQQQLITAIAGLDPDKENREHWTRSGMPMTDALSDVTGDEVSADERSEAYDLYLLLEEKDAEK